jgi:hypothetical protein
MEFDGSGQSRPVKCSVWKFYKVAFRLSGILRQALMGNQPISNWLSKILHNAENKFVTETKKRKTINLQDTEHLASLTAMDSHRASACKAVTAH